MIKKLLSFYSCNPIKKLFRFIRVWMKAGAEFQSEAEDSNGK